MFSVTTWQRHRKRPGIFVIDRKDQKGIIIDIVVSADARVEEKEREKVEKYQDLKRKIGGLWKLKMVEIVPVVIWALGSVAIESDVWIEELEPTILRLLDILPNFPFITSEWKRDY